MEFDNSFDVPLSPAQAWSVLMDVPRIAPCMPGAELTEVVDPQNFGGKKTLAAIGQVVFTVDGRAFRQERLDRDAPRPWSRNAPAPVRALRSAGSLRSRWG